MNSRNQFHELPHNCYTENSVRASDHTGVPGILRAVTQSLTSLGSVTGLLHQWHEHLQILVPSSGAHSQSNAAQTALDSQMCIRHADVGMSEMQSDQCFSKIP